MIDRRYPVNLVVKGVRVVTEKSAAVSSISGDVGSARPVPPPPLPAGAQRALTAGLLLSAVRCTLQYVLIPFVLPWIGIATAIPPWVTLAVGALALASIARNVRYLWRVRHARRWSYLLVAAVVAAALIVFAVVDVRALLRL